MTLYSAIMGPLVYQQKKHSLKDSDAVDRVNSWTNEELLQAISDALVDIKENERVNK